MSASSSIRFARGLCALAVETSRYAIDRVVPSAQAVPDSANKVTAPWLESAIGSAPRTIRAVRVIDEHHGTAARARLAIDGDNVPATLFVKLAPRTLRGRLFMNVMGLGEREVRFYNDIAQQVPVRVPDCSAAVADHRRGRNTIVLEDLADHATFRDITDPLDPGDARMVVEALADLHAAFWASPRFETDLAWLATRHDDPGLILAGALVRRTLQRPTGMVAELVPDEVQRDSQVLIDNAMAIGAFWASEPKTLTHNDTHLGNLFFEDGAPGFLDWQNVGVGAGIRDVAYFLLPSLPPGTARQHERDLVGCYVARLADHGIHVDSAHMWDCYRAAAAQLYVGAVVTGAFGGTLQRTHIARLGIERAVDAVRDLDVFAFLRNLSADNTR